MPGAIEAVLVLILLADLALLGLSRLSSCIRAAALQGMALALLALFASPTWSPRALALALAVFALKGLIFPWLLHRALREASVSREVRPFVGFGLSLLAGVLFLVLSVWLDARLGLRCALGPAIALPVAFATMLTGLFLLVSRRTALHQVIGYLVLECGITAFGIAFAGHVPLLVELGVLMDGFVAVAVMGIAIYRIRETFDHIDADRLNELKG